MLLFNNQSIFICCNYYIFQSFAVMTILIIVFLTIKSNQGFLVNYLKSWKFFANSSFYKLFNIFEFCIFG